MKNVESLVALSDTHLHPLESLLKPYYGADYLVHSGDGLNQGTYDEVETFLSDWEKVSKEFKFSIYVPGNHDIFMGNNWFNMKGIFRNMNSHFLAEEVKDIGNQTFYGKSLIPTINGYWYGESTDIERRETLSLIPKERRKDLIIVSHSPPKGLRDQSVFMGLDGPYMSPNWGCQPLREFIYDNPVKLVICGHIHSGHGRANLNGTEVLNVSICDEDYNDVYKPQVVEL